MKTYFVSLLLLIAPIAGLISYPESSAGYYISYAVLLLLSILVVISYPVVWAALKSLPTSTRPDAPRSRNKLADISTGKPTKGWRVIVDVIAMGVLVYYTGIILIPVLYLTATVFEWLILLELEERVSVYLVDGVPYRAFSLEDAKLKSQ